MAACSNSRCHTPQPTSAHDKHFGGFLKQRIEAPIRVSRARSRLPGVVATRHGPTGGWTFAFGDGRGTRFVTNQNGGLLQDIDYQPFGEVTSNLPLASPRQLDLHLRAMERRRSPGRRSASCNLGARVYDPVIGRFLSRDPLISAGSPYAFADNDPINKSDPTGWTPALKI